MKSKIFLNSSLKIRTKGQLWIPIMAAIGFLLAFPVAELIQLENWSKYGFTVKEIERLYENLWKSGLLMTGLIITFGTAFINGVNGFWYLYSSAKVDFYHCLPVKRSRMFAQKTFAGIFYFLIPYIVMEFLAVCIGAMRGHFSLMLMGMALKMLFAHLVMYLMGYFCVVLAVSLTGNLLMGGLMTAGIFLYGPILGGIIEWGKACFFHTYYGNGRGVIFAFNSGHYFSPFTLSDIFIDHYRDGHGNLKIIVLMLVFTALAAAAAFWAYTKRPMESTGKSMVYRFVSVLVEFMIVIPAGLGTGLLFYSISMGDHQGLWYILGLVFGTVLVHGMLQVIYHLDFRRFLSAKVQLVLTGACVTLAALVFRFDLLGYDTYLPGYENLERFEFMNGYEVFGSEAMNQRVVEQNGNYQISDWWCELKKDKSFYDFVKGIISKQENRITENLGTNLSSFTLRYVNRFGGEAVRQYRINTEEIKEIITACYDRGTFKEDMYSFLQLNADYIEEIRGTFANGKGYVLFQGEDQKYEKLIEALRQDIDEADSDIVLEKPVVLLTFSYEKVPVTNAPEAYLYNQINVYPEYKRTLAILKETGYPLSLEELEMEYVTYQIQLESRDGYVLGEEQKISDRESLNQMKEALLPYEFNLPCLEADERVYVEVKVKGDNWEQPMKLLKDKTPQFLKDAIDEAMEKEEG